MSPAMDICFAYSIEEKNKNMASAKFLSFLVLTKKCMCKARKYLLALLYARSI
jgi:hypothetical protein